MVATNFTRATARESSPVPPTTRNSAAKRAAKQERGCAFGQPPLGERDLSYAAEMWRGAAALRRLMVDFRRFPEQLRPGFTNEAEDDAVRFDAERAESMVLERMEVEFGIQLLGDCGRGFMRALTSFLLGEMNSIDFEPSEDVNDDVEYLLTFNREGYFEALEAKEAARAEANRAGHPAQDAAAPGRVDVGLVSGGGWNSADCATPKGIEADLNEKGEPPAPAPLSREAAEEVSRMLILGMHFFCEVTKSRELAEAFNLERPGRIPDVVIPDDPVMDMNTGGRFCEAIMSLHWACRTLEG